MDVLEEALELFKYCLDFYQEWRIAERNLKKDRERDQEIEIDGEYTSMERELFAHTLERHVGIGKKFMLELYADFDLYVIDKNRNPFVIVRPGKKNKKIRFGSKRYRVEVNAEPEEVFTLFDRLTKESFTKKELDMLNKLYRGTVNVCRLQDFMDDVKNDPPSERGEEVVVEMMATDGRMVRGVMTYSPHATVGKDLDDHLEAINTCKNLSGIEMHFINEIEFGLKIIVAKLKRMKSPYITAIQSVVRISEVPVTVPVTQEDSVDVDVSELEKESPMTWDAPPEGVKGDEGDVGARDAVYERGGGDAGGDITPFAKTSQRLDGGETFETRDFPFAEHPETCEGEEDKPTPKRASDSDNTGVVEIPPIPNLPSKNNCCIQ